MKTVVMTLVTGMACLLAAGCGKKEPAQSPEKLGQNPVTAPVDYLGAVAKAQRSAIKTIDTAGLSQAVKLFEAEQGRFPTNLQELVSSGTLQSLPKPPHGMKLDYNPTNGQIKVVPVPE